MRRRRDIFGNGSGRMSGIRNLSPAQLVTRILGILSVILAIVMVVNLNRIMARWPYLQQKSVPMV